MRAYSIDLRQRVVAAYDAGEGTQEQVAARFAVSTSWVRKILRQRRQTGSIEPKPHGGGNVRAFDGEADARLRQAVRDEPDATLEELGRAAGVAGELSDDMQDPVAQPLELADAVLAVERQQLGPDITS